MKYIDISQKIFAGMKKYPSDPEVMIQQFKSLKKGNSCNLLKLVLGSHTGTHVDAPRHIFNKAATVDTIKINDLICDVVITSVDRLREKSFLKRLKQRNIKGVFLKRNKDKPELTIDEANLLLENNMKVVGTESMTIEQPGHKLHPVHKLLLSRGVIIIESLNLRNVKFGVYRLICLPLRIANGDGAPARAILVAN